MSLICRPCACSALDEAAVIKRVVQRFTLTQNTKRNTPCGYTLKYTLWNRPTTALIIVNSAILKFCTDYFRNTNTPDFYSFFSLKILPRRAFKIFNYSTGWVKLKWLSSKYTFFCIFFHSFDLCYQKLLKRVEHG